MELVTKKRLVLVAGRGHEELSAEVAEHLRVPLGEVVLSTFSNGEIYCRYGESVRGADVFVFQTHCEPTNDRLMEQLIMIDAAKRASAKRITAVCPFYGYARQDRKAEAREPIDRAKTLVVASGERYYEPEIHRIDAEVVIAEADAHGTPSDARDRAAAILQTASECASRQGRRSAAASVRVSPCTRSAIRRSPAGPW